MNTITLGGILSLQIMARELAVGALPDNAEKEEVEIAIFRCTPDSTILSFLWNVNINY